MVDRGGQWWTDTSAMAGRKWWTWRRLSVPVNLYFPHLKEYFDMSSIFSWLYQLLSALALVNLHISHSIPTNLVYFIQISQLPSPLPLSLLFLFFFLFSSFLISFYFFYFSFLFLGPLFSIRCPVQGIRYFWRPLSFASPSVLPAPSAALPYSLPRPPSLVLLRLARRPPFVSPSPASCSRRPTAQSSSGGRRSSWCGAELRRVRGRRARGAAGARGSVAAPRFVWLL